MSAYHLYLFVHICGAIAWVGASLFQALLGARVVRAGGSVRLLEYAHDGDWASLHLYAPANSLTLVSGLLLVHAGGFGFGTLWIDLGMGGLVVSLLIGGIFLNRGFARAAKIADLHGSADQLRAAVQQIVAFTTIDLAVLTGVVYVMAIKPTSGDPAALAVGGAAVAIVLLLSGRVLRGDHRQRHEAVGTRDMPSGDR